MLTDAKIRALRVGDRAFGEVPGFRGSLMVRADAKGKSFFYRYRNEHDGDRALPLGRYGQRGGAGVLTLAEAQAKATALAMQLQETPDLATHKALQKERDIEARRVELRERKAAADRTLGALCDIYVGFLRDSGKKAHNDVRTLFAANLSDELRATPAAAVTPSDITAALRGVLQPPAPARPRPRTAGKLRSYLSAAFGLAIRAEADPTAPQSALAFRLTSNPVSAVRAHTGVQARDRVLTEQEMQFLLRRLNESSDVLDDALSLTIRLGGQRPGQLLRAAADDVQDGVLVLRDGKGRRSSPRRHALPLTAAAQQIVERRLNCARTRGTPLLFVSPPRVKGSDGEADLTATKRGKARAPATPRAHVRLETLSKHVRQLAAEFKAANPTAPGAPFQLRDIRRTCETMLAGAGISRDIRAQLLSHGLAGVQQQHYDRHDYLREKRHALDVWDGILSALAEGRTSSQSNVVPLRGAA